MSKKTFEHKLNNWKTLNFTLAIFYNLIKNVSILNVFRKLVFYKFSNNLSYQISFVFWAQKNSKSRADNFETKL